MEGGGISAGNMFRPLADIEGGSTCRSRSAPRQTSRAEIWKMEKLNLMPCQSVSSMERFSLPPRVKVQ